MWHRVFFIFLTLFSIGNAYGTLPHGQVDNLRPFKFRVADSQIREFKSLLATSKIGPETWYTNNGDGEFGTTREWLMKAKHSWMKFDWRKQENRINSFPNFELVVEDAAVGATPIHFTALFSKKLNALPIMFLHGWPGSFLEFLPMLDILKKKYTPETLPYHVIVPSLPQYGLSGGSTSVEFTMEDAARLLDQLMLDLGFGSGYVVQGGDIGSFLTRILSTTSKSVKAFHVNMLASGTSEEIFSTANITQADQDHLQRMYTLGATGTSYILAHGQRPSTMGLMLSTNPLAMLTWIGEKLVAWPDNRYPLSMDTVLTLVSFYWYTDTFPRSLYPYRALANSVSTGGLVNVPTSKEKPFGYSVFPAENLVLPESWAEQIYPNMVYYQRNEKGGHFAALEQPAIFMKNVEDFIQATKL